MATKREEGSRTCQVSARDVEIFSHCDLIELTGTFSHINCNIFRFFCQSMKDRLTKMKIYRSSFHTDLPFVYYDKSKVYPALENVKGYSDFEKLYHLFEVVPSVLSEYLEYELKPCDDLQLIITQTRSELYELLKEKEILDLIIESRLNQKRRELYKEWNSDEAPYEELRMDLEMMLNLKKESIRYASFYLQCLQMAYNYRNKIEERNRNRRKRHRENKQKRVFASTQV